MQINPGKLREWVDVYEVKVDEDDMYHRKKEVKVFEARCRFDEVWLKDYQTAVSLGTVEELKIFMRYDERLTNKMKIKRELNGATYEIKRLLIDEKERKYMHVFVRRVDN